VRSSGIVVQLFCAPGSAGAAGRFHKLKSQGASGRLERGVVVCRALIPGFALPVHSEYSLSTVVEPYYE
jgi:hypothetical protein